MQVRETILTSALLQLPLSMSRRDKLACVDDIISQLVCCHAVHADSALLVMLSIFGRRVKGVHATMGQAWHCSAWARECRDKLAGTQPSQLLCWRRRHCHHGVDFGHLRHLSLPAPPAGPAALPGHAGGR